MRLQRLILIRNGAVALDLILDLVDLVLLYEKRICLYMRNILFLEYTYINTLYLYNTVDTRPGDRQMDFIIEP